MYESGEHSQEGHGSCRLRGMSHEASSDAGGIGDTFRTYAKQLDAVNERRERLVKASRDVTIASKKVIFAVHR